MSQHALEFVRSMGNIPARYGNFLGGKWVAPLDGQYFTDYSPINGQRLVEVAKSTPADVEAALDAAYKAKDGWARLSPAERSRLYSRFLRQSGRKRCRAV
jgi:aldehyde dehydrogenase